MAGAAALLRLLFLRSRPLRLGRRLRLQTQNRPPVLLTQCRRLARYAKPAYLVAGFAALKRPSGQGPPWPHLSRLVVGLQERQGQLKQRP